MKKVIKYNNKWYKVGDELFIIRNTRFLFFWSRKKYLKHIITFIGDDCAASCKTDDKNVWDEDYTITGSVKYI